MQKQTINQVLKRQQKNHQRVKVVRDGLLHEKHQHHQTRPVGRHHGQQNQAAHTPRVLTQKQHTTIKTRQRKDGQQKL